jgi:hypothetical protein
MVFVSNLRIVGPANAQGTGEEVILDQARRDVIRMHDVSANFAWGVIANNYGEAETVKESVSAQRSYSDAERFSDSIPVRGRYEVGTRIHRHTGSAGAAGWVVVRSGYAAPTWAGRVVYRFGEFVVPVGDNGHFYMQTSGAGCVSSGAEPRWSVDTGATVGDGDCRWKESGPAFGVAELNK